VTNIKVLSMTTPGLKGSGVSLRPSATPAATVKTKLSGPEWLDAALKKIRKCLAQETAGMSRDERTDLRVRALALALGVIERANQKGNKGTRNAVVRKVKDQAKERTPRQPAKLLLQVVKVCFPKSKVSDQSQYTRFIAACLMEDWTSSQVVKRFAARREKSRQRNAERRSANKKYRPAVGIKEFAKVGKVLLKDRKMLRHKLPVLMDALTK